MDVVLQISLMLLYFFSVIAIADAVLHARTSQGAIAWTVSLLTVPFISLPLYLVFGRRTFDKYIEARKNLDSEINCTAQHLAETLQPYRHTLRADEQRLQVMESIAPLPFTRANTIDLLIDGEETFLAILRALSEAKCYIIVQFYILRHDNIGRQLQKQLIEKARQNVDVYVLYDSIGSFELDDQYVDDMKRAGIHAFAFNSTSFRSNRFQMNFRNHRKIVIVDGETAFLGGFNVGDEYLAQVPDFPVWRDTHFKLSGPCVQLIQLAFAEDWVSVTDKMPNLHWEPLVNPSDQNHQHCNLLVLPWGPVSAIEEGTFSFLHLINAAQKRIWLASPYFIPDVVMRSALQLAVLRGVEVRILVPKTTDNFLNQLSTFANVKRLSDSGIKFYFYAPGFMHQKILLIDDAISFVGTANFSNRSFRLNFEINVLVSDAGFAARVETMLLKDFGNSYQVTKKMIESAPVYFRLLSPIARLVSPIL